MIGQNLGRYQIIEQLGAGGMAIVYKAFDPQLYRDVAIKVIRPGAISTDQTITLIKRFNREAKMLAGLGHPNIVKVLDFGEENGAPYLVMEYVVGGSLKNYLKERGYKPVPWRETAQLLAPIARALESAHNHKDKIIHRDVKPSNILIDKYGAPLLTDFGIAKVFEGGGHSDLTVAGIGIGTPEYMAPEQGTDQPVDHRVDMYALGIVFFEMLTGRRPYQADTPRAVMIMKINDPLPRPTLLVPGLPKAIEWILFKVLARNPDDRYSDMGEFAEILEGLAYEKLPVVPLPTPPASFLQERYNRLLKFLVLGGIGLVVILGMFLLGGNRFSSVSIQVPSTAPQTPLEGPALPTNTETALPSTESIAPTMEFFPPTTRDGADLVFIPSGEFLMGSDPDEPYFWGAEAPKHTVYLDSFWIYRTEVTNSMYRVCVESGVCPAPRENGSHTHEEYFISSQFDGYPVIHVRYEDAAAYCEWAGARLPTEAEWEKAARGTEGALFPWDSDELQNDFANFCDEGCPGHSVEFTEQGFDDGYRDVAPVGSYPAGASPFGALDMAGNVLEWVSDWYAVDYYRLSPKENPTGPESGTRHIIRGGSWWSLREGLRPAARASKSPDYSSDMVGFRCAMDEP